MLWEQISSAIGPKWHKKRPFGKLLEIEMCEASKRATTSGMQGAGDKFELTWRTDHTRAGCFMEAEKALMDKAVEEVKEAQKVIQDLSNDISQIHEFVAPKLISIIRDVRQKRMSVVRELQMSLTAMRDVRRFFLESEYEEEMRRLERFVGLAQTIKELIVDGTFDAICDASLKLAMTERGGKDGRQ